MKTELELKENDLELVVSEKTLGHLTTNALQIKEMVENALPQYSSSNYDSSNIDKAKKDKATLNKASKALNAKRIEIEKEFVKPFAEFKNVISETVKLINDCSSKIDEIVKEEEEKYKSEKRSRIIDYYNQKGTPISFDRVEKEEWLNKGSKEQKVFEEIDGIVSSINSELETLSKMPDSESLQVYYKQCLDLNKTLQYATQLNEQKRMSEERKKEEELRRSEEELNNNKPNNPMPNQAEPEKENKEEVYIRSFRVSCSREQLISLGNFMNENNIKFEKI